MPKSHDKKPRFKVIREERAKRRAVRVAKEKKKATAKANAAVVLSKRQAERRVLRRHYLEACKAQRELEASLRAIGIKWRVLEQAVNTLAGGKWQSIDDVFLDKLCEARGLKFAA